jgi:site-specific recombinase XerD
MGALGSLRLDELTDTHMRQWWASLDELSPNTANKHLSVVRAIFAWAARDGSWGRIDDPTPSLRRRPLDAAARPRAPSNRSGRSARVRRPRERHSSW